MAEVWYKTYRTDGTFVFTSPGGKFRFHVIGHGGNGMAGGSGMGASGGSGGYGGGYCIHEVTMAAGETATIIISDSATTLRHQSVSVVAQSGSYGWGASGGNISNTEGRYGSSGFSGSWNSGTGWTNYSGSGGAGARSVGKYQANGASGGGGSDDGSGHSGNSPVNTDTSIGGAGGGGGGGKYNGGLGGKGAPGGVVIELINTAPIAPSWIDVPSSVLGGKTVSVRWGEASDIDNNLAGYVLERAVNGGGWEELYRGGNRELIDSIIMGWTTVQYRVKAYDSVNHESGYIVSALRNVTNNTPPTSPSLYTPDRIFGGTTINVSWGGASDAENNLVGYTLEQSVNGGEWRQIADTTGLTTQVPITFGWNTVQFRIRAYDAYGAVGTYTVSALKSVINNRIPVISGEDRDLGSMSNAFTPATFIVTDADGDSVAVEVLLDGKSHKTFTAVLGAENRLELSADAWRSLLNGTHTWKITATDTKGASCVRRITFTKQDHVANFRLSEPLPADAAPTKCILSIQGSFPAGSVVKVEVCNNAYDETPDWDDITTKAFTGQKHFFRNTEKTADKWGLGIRASLERKAATGDCYIHSIRGNYA